MLVGVSCKRCGEVAKLDIGDLSKEEIIKKLKKQDSFQCFGNHVELCSPLEYWVIDWDSIEEGSAMTEEDFVADLKSKHEEVLTTEELSAKYTVEGFAYGGCCAVDKKTGEEVGLLFTHSPKGKRYYYR